jgi:hypothetical protein
MLNVKNRKDGEMEAENTPKSTDKLVEQLMNFLRNVFKQTELTERIFY